MASMTPVTISPATSPLMQILAIFDSEEVASVRRDLKDNWPIPVIMRCANIVGPY
jgi:hypothetical protein